MVLEFYKRELPGWQEDRLYDRGFRLVNKVAEVESATSIYYQSGRTQIDYSIIRYPGGASGLLLAASDSRLGVLR